MHSAIAAFVLALVITTVATPAVRAFAVSAGVVDTPGGRRVHKVVTPRLGGIAVMVGFFVPLAAFAVIKTAVMRSFMERPDLLMGLVLGALVVGVVGAIDDVRTVGPWMKLGAQAVAAVVAYAFGYRIDAVNLPLVGNVDMALFALPLTVLWFLAITNALNLIDGLDGLAAGIALFATTANFVIAAVRGSDVVMLLSGALGGALLGFLRYNFNPAVIFLGDSGSMFLGFALAATAIGGQLTKSSTAISVLAPMLALGIPIVDTLLAMIRRALARQSIFAADRGHIHHRLLDLGFTHRRVVLTLYGLSVALAVCAVAVAIGHARQIGLALAAFGGVLYLAVRAVHARARLRRATELQRDSALAGLEHATRLSLREFDVLGDEVALRSSLAKWTERNGLVEAAWCAGEPVVERGAEDAQLRDMTFEGRRRYLRLRARGAVPLADPLVSEHLEALARACEAAAERCTRRAAHNTARFQAVSATATGPKD